MKEEKQPEWAARLEAKIDEVLEHFHVGTERQSAAYRAEVLRMQEGFTRNHPSVHPIAISERANCV